MEESLIDTFQVEVLRLEGTTSQEAASHINDETNSIMFCRQKNWMI